MQRNQHVLVIGILPEKVDCSAHPGMNAASFRAGIASQVEKLRTMGYEAESCYVARAETAEAVLTAKLAESPFGAS